MTRSPLWSYSEGHALAKLEKPDFLEMTFDLPKGGIAGKINRRMNGRFFLLLL